MIKGQYSKTPSSQWSTGEGPFGKRTKWSMAEMVKGHMLEYIMEKDEMTKWHDAK